MEARVISEITDFKPQLLRGPVSQVENPKQCAEFQDFICENCGATQSVPISPTDESIAVPDYCPMDTGCGSSRKGTKFIPLQMSGRFFTVVPIRLHHRGTWFNLSLQIEDSDPPKKGDWIEFHSSPIPRIKGKSLITSWNGVAKGYTFLGRNPKN
tara:strand:- start:129 stop:593 length:465 start_codon:yes stop_codon:yes gene_type:complete